MNKKMSNEKFRIILLPIIAIVIILAIVLSVAADIYSASLDMVLGRGVRIPPEMHGKGPPNSAYSAAADNKPLPRRNARSCGHFRHTQLP